MDERNVMVRRKKEMFHMFFNIHYRMRKAKASSV